MVTEAGCTTTQISHYTATVTGNSIDWNGTVESKHGSGCFGLPDYCQSISLTGTRIGDAPDPCSSGTNLDLGGNGGGGGGGGVGVTMNTSGTSAPGTVEWSDAAASVTRLNGVYYVTAGLTESVTISFANVPGTPGTHAVDYMNPLGAVTLNYLENQLVMTYPTGSFTVTTATDSRLAGSFSVSGDVGVVPPIYARTLSGTFDLSVDYAGKRLPAVPGPKEIFRMMAEISE